MPEAALLVLLMLLGGLATLDTLGGRARLSAGALRSVAVSAAYGNFVAAIRTKSASHIAQRSFPRPLTTMC